MVNHPNRKKRDAILEQIAHINPESAPVERSFAGIREALFEEWDRLRNGQTTAENARSAARMADVILGSVETQLETLKFAKVNAQAPLLLK